MYINKIVSVSITILMMLGDLSLSSGAQAEIKHSKATYKGEQSCRNLFPANNKYSKAQYNLLKGGCWSCPNGFKRTTNPLPDKHKSCKKPRPYTDAKFHSHATGILKNICKGEPWLKGQKCWNCPSGFKRTNKKSNGKVQCKPRIKSFYHPATRRGEAGCSAGQWSPLLSGKCYSCPTGYFRNPSRVSLDRTKDAKACFSFVKSKKEQGIFINKNIKHTLNILKDNQKLSKMSGEFVKKLKKILERKGGVKNLKNLTKKDIRAAGGVQLAQESCNKGYPSISLTGGVDGSYFVVGANGSVGVAFGLEQECGDKQDGKDWIDQDTDFGIATLGTINGSLGPSLGADVPINVGFWKASYNQLHGFSHGIVLGGSYYHGAEASGWWSIKWGGKKDEFAGFALGYQAGMSGEVEYNWGYTFQKK